MRNAARLARYHDLVFSPLALPCPPRVDAARLVGWMAWAREGGRQDNRNNPERSYESLTDGRYPWLMATVDLAARSPIEESFEREFPALARYVAEFPLRGPRTVVLLAQRERSSVYLHTDLDGYWGFRFYLARQQSDALYFCMARERVESLPRIAPELSRYVEGGDRHYARWPGEELAYCLNSVRAAHAVEANECRLGERIACLVQSREGIDEDRLLDLLDESTARFANFQIWYPGASRQGPP